MYSKVDIYPLVSVVDSHDGNLLTILLPIIAILAIIIVIVIVLLAVFR